jgi:hypothetical protein
MVASIHSPSRTKREIDSIAETPYDESKRHAPSLPEEPETGDKVRLRTLGDGPCAPGAVSEADEADVDDADLEVSPGYKGWINLVGVSRVNKPNHQLMSQAVAVNMLCCKSVYARSDLD